jgi:hypothetical protein
MALGSGSVPSLLMLTWADIFHTSMRRARLAKALTKFLEELEFICFRFVIAVIAADY